jgi:flagellar basal body-associated protein FliL
MRNMKKCLIAIAMVLTFSMNADAAAQKHRHTPRTEQVDSTKTKDAIEAFSDTTATADANDAEDDQYVSHHRHSSFSVSGFPDDFFDNFDGKDIAGMIFVLLIILTIFLFAPIGIIIAIFYFVNKNRREKYRLAQMAMQNGQPIPNDLLNEKQDDWDRNDYQAGIRQMFTGVGLAIFLGITAGKYGFSIGALVFFIGLGKWFVARQAGTTGNRPRNDNHSSNFNNNNSNIQNYD